MGDPRAGPRPRGAPPGAHSFVRSLARGALPRQPRGTEPARGPPGPQCLEPRLVTEATLGRDVTKSYRNDTAVSCREEAERRAGWCSAGDGRVQGEHRQRARGRRGAESALQEPGGARAKAPGLPGSRGTHAQQTGQAPTDEAGKQTQAGIGQAFQGPEHDGKQRVQAAS